jgi:Flp pilus assembly protein protease CpaA
MLPLAEFAIYFLAAIVISHSDLQFRIIRNRDLSIFLALCLIIKSSEITLNDFSKMIYITLICVALYLLFKGKIGAGDLKLFWVVSFWTSSISKWLVGLSFSWILGGLFAISYMAFTYRSKKRNLSIPFAPFIFLGFLPVI